MNIIDELTWRGAINQMSDEVGLRKKVEEKSIGVYCGVDPTGDSLHIGHLIPFMMLKRFQMAGHRAHIIIGGELDQLVIHPEEVQNEFYKRWNRFIIMKKR